jgi:hypothetical protein
LAIPKPSLFGDKWVFIDKRLFGDNKRLFGDNKRLFGAK